MNSVTRMWENINVQSAEKMQVQIGFPFAHFKLLTIFFFTFIEMKSNTYTSMVYVISVRCSTPGTVQLV